MLNNFTPNARRQLRLYSANDAAELFGVSSSFLHKLLFDGRIAVVHKSTGGRRHYSVADLNAIRTVL